VPFVDLGMRDDDAVSGKQVVRPAHDLAVQMQLETTLASVVDTTGGI
jgi:hypothetical protein